MKASEVLIKNLPAIIRNAIANRQWDDKTYRRSITDSISNLLENPLLEQDIRGPKCLSVIRVYLRGVGDDPGKWIRRIWDTYGLEPEKISIKAIEREEGITLGNERTLKRIFKEMLIELEYIII